MIGNVLIPVLIGCLQQLGWSGTTLAIVSSESDRKLGGYSDLPRIRRKADELMANYLSTKQGEQWFV
jgi:hypothetical protein